MKKNILLLIFITFSINTIGQITKSTTKERLENINMFEVKIYDEPKTDFKKIVIIDVTKEDFDKCINLLSNIGFMFFNINTNTFAAKSERSSLPYLDEECEAIIFKQNSNLIFSGNLRISSVLHPFVFTNTKGYTPGILMQKIDELFKYEFTPEKIKYAN